MRRALLSLGVAGAVAIACNGSFPFEGAGKRIVVTRTAGDPGTPATRMAITFSSGPTFKLKLEMHSADGNIDDTFNGWVRISAKPGTVLPLQRSVKLTNGVATDVPVTLAAAFGDTRIWAEDDGYTPTVPGSMTMPQCSNGIDDNGDGTIDFPADPGCFAPDDDDEKPGTLATGTSDILYFQKPRVADIRGVAENNGTATAFPHEQVSLDTGYHSDTNTYDFDVVVTRIASDGFYITDVQDQNARGYASVFAFTFSAPTRLATCDRLRSLNGTASDFFGFTEIGFPTYTVEYYNPSAPARPCLVPEPRVLAAGELGNLQVLFKYTAALVRVQTGGNVTVHVGKHIGAAVVPKCAPTEACVAGKCAVPMMPATCATTACGVYCPGDTASSCDLNGNNKVDFSNMEEATCSNACTADVECSEYSSYKAQSNFRLVVTDTAVPVTATIQGNGSASPSFNPEVSRGATLSAFTGTIRYFSGGQQFTIEARCGDDIVDMGGMQKPTDKACVPAVRPELDLNEMSH